MLYSYSLIRKARSTGDHFTEEIIDEAICQAEATEGNQTGMLLEGTALSGQYIPIRTCTCVSPYLCVQNDHANG